MSHRREIKEDKTNKSEEIREHIDNTREKIEIAEDMWAKTSSYKTKKGIEDKNQRRKEAIGDYKKELKDETNGNKDSYY